MNAKPIGQTQHALHDVLVPMHHHRAAVPRVREHRDARVDGALEHVAGGVRVPGGDDDPFAREQPDHGEARVLLRRERDDPGQA